MTRLADIIGERNLTWPEGPETDTIPGEEHPVLAAGGQILDKVVGGGDPEALGGWRGVIDQLDLLVMAAVAARVMATEKVGELKVKHGLNPVDTGREQVVIQRAGRAAEAIGLDKVHGKTLAGALIQKAHRQYSDARRATST